MNHNARGQFTRANDVVSLIPESRGYAYHREDIRWHQRNHDFEPGWLSTRVGFRMNGNGTCECFKKVRGRITGTVDPSYNYVRLNRWECFH